MNSRTLDFPQLRERILLARAACGARVAVIPKPGFSTAAGYFGVRFGSTDTRFRDPSGRLREVPDGSAHFLEHKLFEGREEKVFDRFGRLGAEFNGGTGFHTTSYYFVSAGRFDDCLEVLLDFVQHPLLTAERVEKEKGIIEQEVRMYEDHPGYRGIFLLHRALYARHPLRIPPGGTVESVRATTVEDLELCFDSFYRPQRLCLAVAGDFDPEVVQARIEERLDPARPGEPTRESVEEGELPAAERLEEEFPVTRPMVWLGFRERRGSGLGPALLRRRLLSSLAIELIFGESSSFHEDLYRAGVIDDSFQSGYSCDADYGYAVFSGQTEDVEGWLEGVREALARFRADGPTAEDLERVRRGAWGAYVSGFQAPAALASSVLRSLLDESAPFAALEVLASVDRAALHSRAEELFDPARAAIAVLRPPRA